jgi:hypothetical protein
MFRALIVFVAPVLAFAAEPDGMVEKPDKSRYHLFNPTPVSLLREMSTDRPDKTESPYTIDAGHFQIESDLVTYTHDHDTSGGQNLHGDGWSFGTLNLKAGLCNSADFQVILFPYNRIRTEDRVGGTINRQDGFGDILTRLKVNLWGNDGGACAGGVMPFIKWPTSQDQIGNQAIEGGLILPVTFELPAGFSCGFMTEFDWIEDSNAGGYHPEFVNSITFSHKLIEKLDGYAEFYSLISAERSAPWIGTLDFGLTYALSANTQLDAGVNIGLTKSAADLNPFVGFSIRF